MRDLILLAGAAIALSACNPQPSAQERTAAEQNVTSLVVATNDITAIDAATGEDADMAADVAFLPDIGNEAGGNQAAPAADRPRAARSSPARTSPAPRRDAAPEPAEPESPVADEPESNSP